MPGSPGNTQNRQWWESTLQNDYAFLMYYSRLTELSVSMFEWKNLPDTVDPRFLELALFRDGMAVFFKDEDLTDEEIHADGSYLCLRTMIGGRWDVYNVPTIRRAYASNGYNRELNQDNSVIIFNNYLRTNSMLMVEEYARKLAELDRIIEVNAKAQKTPVLIQCDETQRLTMKNLYMKYDGNEPFIFADKKLNPNCIKVLTTDAPYVCDKLYQLKSQIWNEALTYLGISNLNVQKKERLVSDEVMRNMGGTIASRYSRLEIRRQACQEINKMFGLNLDVFYREDFREMDDEVMFHGKTGDEEMSIAAYDLRTQ